MSDSDVTEKDTDTFIKNELSKFVYKHTGQDALSAIDEIVLSYMVSILESLGSPDAAEDAFDVDQFSEMMSAYIPAFTNINSAHICEWMFQLAGWLKKTTKQNGIKSFTSNEALFCIPQSTSPSCALSLNFPTAENVHLSSSPRSSGSSSRSRSTSQSEDEERYPTHISRSSLDVSQQLEILTEMFPHICAMEVQQCLTMAEGDCEKAVQLILQRQDCGQQLSSPLLSGNVQRPGARRSSENALEDKKLRQQILNRYAYIDKDDDAREHKPVAPKSEPKKLIRYRDNKIVSVKGERYSEVKTEENEDLKKTYVSLKPARQYRFH